MREFGRILHHNIDKGLLAAGRTEKRFAGGKVLKPMQLIIGDRATFRAEGKEIPVNDIAVDTAKKWIRENLRSVDPEGDVDYRSVLAEGSEELMSIFARAGDVRVANDTSAAIGYYPLSPTENVVLELERYLNSREFKGRFPDTGEDAKVMGLRKEDALSIVVAMPLLCRHISSEEMYFARKREIHQDMLAFLNRFRNKDFKHFTVHYNTLDLEGKGLNGVYVSLLGTSAEDADSGQVGRGNAVNGVIPLFRPLGSEAVAGKNPVSHVGKIYSVLAHKTAKALYESLEDVKEAHVFLLSRIGDPIDRPRMTGGRLLLGRGKETKHVTNRAKEMLENALGSIPRLCDDLATGKYPIC
jgi:S-adenosylmethionine synthetase